MRIEMAVIREISEIRMSVFGAICGPLKIEMMVIDASAKKFRQFRGLTLLRRNRRVRHVVEAPVVVISHSVHNILDNGARLIFKGQFSRFFAAIAGFAAAI